VTVLPGDGKGGVAADTIVARDADYYAPVCDQLR